MRDRGGWARGGLVVVALGVASNLVLTFVPDVVPEQAAQVILYCMTAVIVVVTPLWVYREVVESSRRLEEEKRRMRGIEGVGGDYSRESDTYEVWSSARERVLCFGVGLTGIAADEDRIAEAVGRGVRVDFIMADPRWLREQRRVRNLMNDFYDEHAFVARVERDRAWVQHSATIADPWSSQPKGYMEFHVFRRRPAWFRLVVSGFDGPRANRPYVAHIVSEIDRLLGYQLAEAER